MAELYVGACKTRISPHLPVDCQVVVQYVTIALPTQVPICGGHQVGHVK